MCCREGPAAELAVEEGQVWEITEITVVTRRRTALGLTVVSISRHAVGA